MNVNSLEVAKMAGEIVKDGLIFLIPTIAVLAGIHLVFSMLMNVMFRDRI